MKNMDFDLNDIENEPSDEQLEALMEAVAIEARSRAEAARAKLMTRLRDDIAHAQQSLTHALRG